MVIILRLALSFQ